MNNNTEEKEEHIMNYINIFDAIDNNNINEVREYINNNGDVNIKDDEGLTPLHYVAFDGHHSIVEYLIANGADVNIKTYLVGYAPLHVAAEYGHHSIVEYLIANGAEVNIKDYSGSTPLYAAAKYGHRTIVEYLIANGADVNIKCDDGSTPLHVAAFEGHHSIVEYLIANGAHVNIQNRAEFTPLHYAAHLGHRSIVEYLIANGADVNTKNNYGATPLDYATNTLSYTADNIPKYINIVNILLPLTNLSDINDIYKLYNSDLNTKVEDHKGIINELMMNRDDERCFIFCHMFNIGTNSVEDNNNKQEKNSLMIGYDAPLDEEEVRPFPPMFDSNLDQSLFDVTLVSEIWKYGRDFLREDEIKNNIEEDN